MRRRTVLALAGVTATGVLAGCLGDDGPDTSSPEAIVEAYYEETENEETYPSEVVHSESPLRDEKLAIELLETSVAVTDPNEADIRERLYQVIEESAIQRLVDIATAASDAAIVAATIEVTITDRTKEDTVHHLVAVEDGEWQFVR